MGLKKRIGNYATSKMLKSFQKKMDKCREQVIEGEYDLVTETLVESMNQGLETSREMVQNPNVDDETVEQVLDNIDPDSIQHEKTSYFMEKLKTMERNEENLLNYIDEFEEYYVSKLEKYGGGR